MSTFFSYDFRKLVYLLPLIFPLYLVKFDVWGLPFNVLEVAVLLLFLLHVVYWAKGYWLLRVKGIATVAYFFRQNKQFLLLSALFFLIAIVAVAIVSTETLLIDQETIYQSRKVALGIFKGWIVIPYLWFSMLWFECRSREDLFSMLYAYIFSALPLVIWAVFQYATGQFITLDGRASGPFINANYLAMYLAPAVAALWVMIVRGILLGFKPVRFLIGAALAMLYSVALLMTQSYGAMLAVVLALLVFLAAAFFIHRHYEKAFELTILRKISYFLAVFAFLLLASAVLLFANTEKWKVFTEFAARSSSSVRVQVYEVAISFVKDSPLLGIGLGQFEPKYNLEAPEILGHAPYEWVMIHPHNTFLAVWLYLGLSGFLLFLWLIGFAFFRIWHAGNYDEAFFRMIGLSLLLVMLVHGMVDTYVFKNDLAMLFWLIIAISILPHHKKILQSDSDTLT